jgi:hypothetical protein
LISVCCAGVAKNIFAESTLNKRTEKMRRSHPKQQYKSLLSASAIALALSVAPAYAQSGSANTGYSVGASTPAAITTTSEKTRTVVGKDNSATNRTHTRSQSRTAYGTDTTASARGGEVITRTVPNNTRSRNSVTVEQTVRSPQNNMRSRTGANSSLQARTGTPTAPQSNNRYSPERLSEIETAVGTTITTIERTDYKTKNDMYSNIDNDNRRIDQQLESSLSISGQNENTNFNAGPRSRINR